MNPAKATTELNNATPPGARRDSLTITDNRTGRQYEIPIKYDSIRAMDLRQIKVVY